MCVYKRFLLIILILSNVLFFASTSTEADETREIKMGILNVEWLTRQSLMAKDISRQIDNRRRKFMTEIKNEEIALRKFDDGLQKKRVILSPEAFAEETRKFRMKSTELRKKVQTRNKELSELRSIANRKLKNAIQKALTQVTKRDKFNLVLRYSPNFILVRPQYLDISKTVLEQLNTNVTKYTIPPVVSKPGK